MDHTDFKSAWIILAAFLSLMLRTCSSSDSSKLYIVYMGENMQDNPSQILHENQMFLASVHDGSVDSARASMLYNYNAFRGFAARMTEAQAAALSKRSGVVSIFPSQKVMPLTTHSWEFMGIPPTSRAWDVTDPSNKAQEDVIIGVIDTGIWPESASFSDEGMPSVPPRWKGQCQSGEQFPSSICNKKIIGARYYYSGNQELTKPEVKSARDVQGHGTHATSIAAGRMVTNMTYNGIITGTARGGAPLSRVAVYKVCWFQQACEMADILAAYDDAIRDGVDIISMSLGGGASPFSEDSMSIGAFHAMRKGILVVTGAGNNGFTGPGFDGTSTVVNVAPWVITVGAATTDRDFLSNLTLTSSHAKNANFMSGTLTETKMNASALVLLGSDANLDTYNGRNCYNGTLDPKKVAGKVVVCHYNSNTQESQSPDIQSKVVEEAGGTGAIIIDDVNFEFSYPYHLPTAHILAQKDGSALLAFLNSSRDVQAFISEAKTVYGSKAAPQVATFSSKGPNAISRDILKPDIVAPGVNILASWSPAMEGLNYKVDTGTSMACPHVTGIAALIKAANPSWSPSAIHSALMTTAKATNNKNQPITIQTSEAPATPFEMGAGFVNPQRAQNPGLVYETSFQDHINFLCAIGYNSTNIGIMTGDNTTSCPQSPPSASNLNYPSVSVSNYNGQASVKRAVKNVGSALSTYKAMVNLPMGIGAEVIPNELTFTSVGQQFNFTVEFNGKAESNMAFGSLSWVNGQQSVTSPIVLLGD